MEQNKQDSGALEQPDKQLERNDDDEPKKQKRSFHINALIARINIYLLMFIFIVVLAAIIVFVSVQRSRNEAIDISLPTQELTPEELEQLRGSDVRVGDPKQQLTIESTTIFSGKVLVKDSIDIAGSLRVGGELSLPGITVSGRSAFDQITGNELSIAGDASIQGQLNVQQNIAVTGGATFGGPVSVPLITIGGLNISNDLTFGRHLDAGGPTPGISTGTAVGGGGTASVSGTDTAGTLTVNTGGSPVAGCFATISFTQAFSGTPHITITPVGSAAAGINYYITRSTTHFSVCTTNSAPAGSSFSFDWLAID